MLQIITKKFFVTDNLYTTKHRGVLYSNYQATMLPTISTVVGDLTPTSTRDNVAIFIYEVEESLEAVRPDGSKEFLLAVGLGSFLEDFAAVTSFALNITCTPNIDLVRRLTQSNRPALGSPKLPKEYVKRVFDNEINWAETDAAQLQTFVNNLVGLERKNFKSVMRAIHRYVNGLHRIADDPNLAYSLLVASIESLAQGFTDFELTWDDYAQDKKQEFDKVLATAPAEIVQGIHNVILKHEHIALRRRYQEFVLKHLDAAFFRADAQLETSPIRHCDIPAALENAYKSRSSYVHMLLELPGVLIVAPSYNDVVMIENKPMFSFHGLARIVSHVIRHVVTHSPKVEREIFDYRIDLPNVIHVSLADKYWIWQDSNYNQNTARGYLNGFLRQLTSLWSDVASAELTDIRPIMTKIESLIPGLAKPEQRLPLLLLYLLFHQHTQTKYHQLNWEIFIEKYSEDFNHPSYESLLAHLLTGNSHDWPLEQHKDIYQKYLKQRYNKNGLQCGALFETGLTLSLAEAYRQTGDEVNARALVKEAVESLPNHRELLLYETTLSSPTQPIKWEEILFPPQSAEPTEEVVETKPA